MTVFFKNYPSVSSSNRFHQVTDPSEVSKNLNYESYQSTSQNLSNDDYSHCDHLFSSEVGNVALGLCLLYFLLCPIVGPIVN